MKKKQIQKGSPIVDAGFSTEPLAYKALPDLNNNLRVTLAVGIITLFISIFFLYLLNYFIYAFYTPDVVNVLTRVISLTFVSPDSFAPEPVERLQFQLSLLCTPLIIFGVFILVNKSKNFFQKNASLAFATNILGVVIFISYFIYLLNTKLRYIPDEMNTVFFEKNLIGKIDFFVAIISYSALIYVLVIWMKNEKFFLKKTVKNTISAIAYLMAAIVIIDIFLYDIFYIPFQKWDKMMETNAVFYSVTQVYAGKSLLVNINAQYGLYAWMLCPLFKVIGLSTFKFGLVMAFLNSAAFFLLYLGIKKIIRQEIISLLIFLSLVFWQYWSARLPFDTVPAFYYQYDPIRSLFPSVSLFLFATFHGASQKSKMFILPLMALSSSFAILWNSDSGVAVFGATFAGLVYSSFGGVPFMDSIKKSIKYTAWMLGSLLFVLLLFLITTKIKSGEWPDFKAFSSYQGMFYVSGFFMLPMSLIGFWNLPALTYLVACVYCAAELRKTKTVESNSIFFLFILGAGLFVYFQGRSYDTNIVAVMYPAIIISGIFCDKMLRYIQSYDTYKLRIHENIAIFFIPFIFVTDGAFSMLYYTPSIHSFAVKNAFNNDLEQENKTNAKINFIKKHIVSKDTVLIIAMNYDSYYYAAGNYYNPVNLAGSTELFFKTELYTLLDGIKNTKYPIVYDANHPLVFDPTHALIYRDTLIKTMSEYTTIKDELPDHSMILLKHGRTYADKLFQDSNTIYYDDYGDFRKYLIASTKIRLPENFSIEFIATIKKQQLVKNSVMFSNAAGAASKHGFVVLQNGEDITQYEFSYGNGTEWCPSVAFKVDTTRENDVLITVKKNIATVYNNGKLCGQTDMKSEITNSTDDLFFGEKFFGTIYELKISKL